MKTTHDFGDGLGPVPAKQHNNPDGTIGGWVASSARVYGNARVSGNAWENSPLQIQGTAHYVNMCSRTELQIGCICMTIAKWREKRVILGQQNGYTQEQIDEYGQYIELAAKLYPPAE